MKLRNKKTGEIIDLNKGSITDVGLGSSIQLQAIDRYNKPIWNYNSLAELNEDWEDYEEPKGKWFISNNGQVHNDDGHERFREERKQIGNYFETKEEAEKAVKKLEAWKRLKDKGFKFDSYHIPAGEILFEMTILKKDMDEFVKDMDLLFGGEE